MFDNCANLAELHAALDTANLEQKIDWLTDQSLIRGYSVPESESEQAFMQHELDRSIRLHFEALWQSTPQS